MLFDVDLSFAPLEFELKLQIKGDRKSFKKRRVGKNRIRLNRC